MHLSAASKNAMKEELAKRGGSLLGVLIAICVASLLYSL
jgi:hypothetical protein